MRAILALLLASAPAVADSAHEVPAKARALAERGRIYHDQGDYTAAIAAFTEAYALAPSPALLFNLAQAYRLAGRCEDAELMYRRYLTSDPDPDARTLAETHLHSVQACAAKVALARADKPVEITVTAPAEPSHLERDVGAGLVIGGGIALGTAVYYAYRAHDDADAVSSAYAEGGNWSAIRDTDARGRHEATMAELVGGAGLAAVAAGVVMYYLGDHQPITVVPHAGGAEVHAAWRF